MTPQWRIEKKAKELIFRRLFKEQSISMNTHFHPSLTPCVRGVTFSILALLNYTTFGQKILIHRNHSFKFLSRLLLLQFLGVLSSSLTKIHNCVDFYDLPPPPGTGGGTNYDFIRNMAYAQVVNEYLSTF